MPTGRPGTARAALLALTALTACTGRGAEHPDVLLVSIDTLRADHVGCYGAERDTTPHLDRLAARALRYERAYATSAWTLPSHASLLAGRHHVALGVETAADRLPDDVLLPVQAFAAAGYRTAAFVDSIPRGLVGAERGFARGFDAYHHAPHGGGKPLDHDAAATVDAALGWLDRQDRERPWLLFLHTKSVHSVPRTTRYRAGREHPYLKPDAYQFRFVDAADAGPWRDAELGVGVDYLLAWNDGLLRGTRELADFPRERLRELEALYDAGVAYVDDALGRLFDALEERGRLDDTLIAVTSDHGEAFLEHHQLFHVELYDEVLRVPLLVHLPGQQDGAVIRRPVSLTCVLPSLAEVAGGAPPPGVTAARLALAPEPGPGALVPPLFFQTCSEQGYRSLALLDGRWKLVGHNYRTGGELAFELYDLARDPGERTPVEDGPLDELRLRALIWWNAARAGDADAADVELDGATLEHLRALGYVR